MTPIMSEQKNVRTEAYPDPEIRKGKKVIISLFDYSGNWGHYYAQDPDFWVDCWDIAGGGPDIIDYAFQDTTLGYDPDLVDIYGILAAPPCTAYASSGARWWKGKDHDPFDCPSRKCPCKTFTEHMDTMAVVTMALVEILKPRGFWAIENPVGRFGSRMGLGSPRLIFDPCDYGDPYTKKTCLWGEFNADLPRTPVDQIEGSRMHKIGQSKKRNRIRSTTPLGFARAFYLANH